MYGTYATPLQIELQVSHRAAGWLATTHLAGLAALPFTTLPAWAALLLGMTVLVSLWHAWSRHVSRRHRAAVACLVWREQDDCLLIYRDGSRRACRLAPCAFVTPWLVILYFRQPRRCCSLLLLPDMVAAESFRRLRVRLRMSAGQQWKSA